MNELGKYPSEVADRFQIRLTRGLRDIIKSAADQSGRSMNTEIVRVLEREFKAGSSRAHPDQPGNDPSFTPKQIETIQRLIRKQTTAIRAQITETALTPQPVITGVGEYITQGGNMVVIKRLTESDVWRGYVDGMFGWSSWLETGELESGVSCFNNIIGPWPKPEEEEEEEVKPELWANLYRGSDTEIRIGMGRFHSKEMAAKGKGGLNKHVGIVLLSHTEGDE